MLVIRRLVDRHRSYTGIFLPGEPPRIFPTTDHEHGRILQIYKQDKAYEGVINDFSGDSVLSTLSAPPSTAAATPGPAAASPQPRQQRKPRAQHRKARQ